MNEYEDFLRKRTNLRSQKLYFNATPRSLWETFYISLGRLWLQDNI